MYHLNEDDIDIKTDTVIQKYFKLYLHFIYMLKSTLGYTWGKVRPKKYLSFQLHVKKN